MKNEPALLNCYCVCMGHKSKALNRTWVALVGITLGLFARNTAIIQFPVAIEFGTDP